MAEPTADELRLAQYGLQTAPTYTLEDTPPGLCMLRPGVVVYQFSWHSTDRAYLQYFCTHGPVRGTEYRRFSTSLYRAADTMSLERPPSSRQLDQNDLMKFPIVSDTNKPTLTSLLVRQQQQQQQEAPLLLDMDVVVAEPLSKEDFAPLSGLIMQWCDSHGQTKPTLNSMDESCAKVLYWLYRRLDTNIDGATHDDRVSLLVSLALNIRDFECDSRTLTLFLSAFHRPALVGWVFMSRQCALDLKYDTHTQASRFARDVYQTRDVFDVAGLTRLSDGVYSPVANYGDAEFLRLQAEEMDGPLSRLYRIVLVDRRAQGRFDTEWSQSIDCGNGEIVAASGTMVVEHTPLPQQQQQEPSPPPVVRRRTEKSTVTEETLQKRVERRRIVGDSMVVEEISVDARGIEMRIACINRNLARTELTITQAMADELLRWTPDEAVRLRGLRFMCDIAERGDGFNHLLDIWRQYGFRVLWLVVQSHMRDARGVVRASGTWYSEDAPRVKSDEDMLWIRTHMADHYGVSVQFELAIYEDSDRSFIQFLRSLLESNEYYKKPSEYKRFQALTIANLYRIYSEYIAEFYVEAGDDGTTNPYVANISVDTLYQFLERLEQREGGGSGGGLGLSSIGIGDVGVVKPRTDDERMDVEEPAGPIVETLRVSQQKTRPSVLRIERMRFTLRIASARVFPLETAYRVPRLVFDMHTKKSHSVTVTELKSTYKHALYLGGGSFGIVVLYRIISDADETRKLVGMGPATASVRNCVVKYQELKDKPDERDAMLCVQKAFKEAGGQAPYHHHVDLLDYASCELNIYVELMSPRGAMSDALGLNRRPLKHYLEDRHGKKLVHGRKPIDIIVQEYVNGQTLQEFLYENINPDDPTLDMGLFLNCIVQLTGYLGALYRKLLFTHNDLKFDNILVEKVTAGNPRVWAYEIGGGDTSRQLCINNMGALLRVGDLGTARFKYKNPWFDVELILFNYMRMVVVRHGAKESPQTGASNVSSAHNEISLTSKRGAVLLIANPRFLDFILSQMRRYKQVEIDFKNDNLMQTEEGETVEDTTSPGKIAHHFVEHILMILQQTATRMGGGAVTTADTTGDMKAVCRQVWSDPQWLNWVREHVRSATRDGLFTVHTAERVLLYGHTDGMPGLDLLLIQALDIAYLHNNDWRRNVRIEHDGAYNRLFAYIEVHWPGMVYDIVSAGEPSYQIMNKYASLSRAKRFGQKSV